MKLVCIADTHREEWNTKIPHGDILIHAGDFDIYDYKDLQNVKTFLDEETHSRKIIIGGNHDFLLQTISKSYVQSVMQTKDIAYLENETIEIKGIKFWGSPNTRIFMNWAFMLTAEQLKENWAQIPEDIDIVITHGPPFGILDQATETGTHLGCPFLRARIKEIKPKYHIFGHIHGGYGVYQDEHTTYINCSLLDEEYELINDPIVVEI